MKKKKTAKKASTRRSPVKKKVAKKAAKKVAKKTAPAATQFKAICNDEGITLSGWTSNSAARAAKAAHEAANPSHSCGILKR